MGGGVSSSLTHPRPFLPPPPQGAGKARLLLRDWLVILANNFHRASHPQLGGSAQQLAQTPVRARRVEGLGLSGRCTRARQRAGTGPPTGPPTSAGGQWTGAVVEVGWSLGAVGDHQGLWPAHMDWGVQTYSNTKPHTHGPPGLVAGACRLAHTAYPPMPPPFSPTPPGGPGLRRRPLLAAAAPPGLHPRRLAFKHEGCGWARC